MRLRDTSDGLRFDIIGDELTFDRVTIGRVVIPEGTLRDRVTGAMRSAPTESEIEGRIADAEDDAFRDGYHACMREALEHLDTMADALDPDNENERLTRLMTEFKAALEHDAP